jgi:uncharacterized surface anchored protein
MAAVQGDRESNSQATVAEESKDKGIVRGIVTYPWGTVNAAKITVGDKTAASDSEGAYEVSALAPGEYTIAAEAPFPGYEATPQTVEVAAGEVKKVDIYFDFKKTIVEGHVYDLDGKPIAGASLSGVIYGMKLHATTTDEKGYFRFDEVTPGDRFIRVNAPGYMGDTRDFTAVEKSTTTLEFRLTSATCKLHGVVTDTAGKAVQAEMLLLKSGIVVQKTSSDPATGYYEFPLLPGNYQLLPVAPMYQPSAGWRGVVSSDTRIDFSMTLAPPVRDESDTYMRH